MKTQHSLQLSLVTLACLAFFQSHAGAQTAATPPAAATPDAQALPGVKVVGDRDIGLRAERASSTTKGSTPLMQTPMSVQVVPQALVEDRQANTLREALETVSGVFAGSTSVHEDIIVRGFPVYDSYRNGVKTRRFGPTELANAERVEVLKGPSSTQFGRGDISGMFNVVTKKPQADTYVSLQQQIGSEDFLQTHLDATGALNPDKTLLYRFNAVYEDAGSFRDFIDTKRYFIAPTLSWRPNADVQFNLELEHANHDSPIDRGIVAVGERPADVPRSRNLGESFTGHENRSTLLSLDGSQKLDATWTLRQNLMLEHARGEGLEYQHELVDGERTIGRIPRRIQQRDVDTQFVSLELAGTPQWGGLGHDFVVGVDHARSKGRFDFWEGELDPTIPGFLLDIHQPAYTGIVPETPVHGLDVTNRSRAWGVYAQDQIRLTPEWQLLLGGRYDNARQTSDDHLAGSVSKAHDKRFSPRVGIVFSPAAWWSLYGSYTESLSDANAGTLASGAALDPIVGKQYEIGFKAETLDKRLFTTVALYQLTKQNIVVPDAQNPGYAVQLGEARSRGLEWDMGGRVTPHLNLTASYAYTQTEVTRDAAGPESTEGNRLYGVPRHAVKLFARWDQQAGGSAGLSLGAGMVALSEQEVDAQNSARIPGYARFDLMAAYKWRNSGLRWTAQLNLLNADDKTYYLPSGSRHEIAFGRPRTVLASLRAEY
ncbi:TonB-dependent siderophore receptor [Aquabacterium sp. A7-Y]|uniref:TonB-dependent siderophore receptor n=1 Tax=Aquabacterium sp. A7-Y TaxID=1349605 RepID=UPI00223E7EF2|nr:TonB-dependent siderophore receptor [Aquabacterium sp. A7-Y]MCW7539364.1 TonB-dependent siderophore receptor [Aquabacterium sp. A7-Y]